MRTSNFDAIAASAPLNREASTVRDGSGDLWEAKNVTVHRWPAPPPLKTEQSIRQCGQEELRLWVGRKIGRLTVLGIAAEHAYKGSAMWVCRCACGYYEGRKLAKLRAADPGRACCSACGEIDRIRWLGSQKNTSASRAAETSRLDELARREWAA